jgi:uncharacterized protein (DUF58 family)
VASHPGNSSLGTTRRIGSVSATPQLERRSRWRLLSRMAAQWLLQRLPLQDTWELTQRNIYILPTKSGLAFTAMLGVMLVASINYQLNLGYLLTFLLGASALVSMHLTHGNLRALQLQIKPIAAVFAGEPAELEVVLHNPKGSVRHGLNLRFQFMREKLQDQAWCDVPAFGHTTARLSMVPESRGWHAVPALVVEARFPFGLFRAWTVWRPAAQVLAWPRPEQPAPPLPTAQAVGGEATSTQRIQGNELEGVRAWRRGDSLRQVVWKKVARTGELVSRDTQAQATRELWLDWQGSTQALPAIAAADTEARLSRLAAWVMLAQRESLPHGLRLPGRHWEPGLGEAHRRTLLEALALWR